MEGLKEKLGEMIKDEVEGVDKYKELAQMALNSEDIAEPTKMLIAETFMGIRADEAKHRQLLKFIYSML